MNVMWWKITITVNKVKSFIEKFRLHNLIYFVMFLLCVFTTIFIVGLCVFIIHVLFVLYPVLDALLIFVSLLKSFLLKIEYLEKYLLDSFAIKYKTSDNYYFLFFSYYHLNLFIEMLQYSLPIKSYLFYSYFY